MCIFKFKRIKKLAKFTWVCGSQGYTVNKQIEIDAEKDQADYKLDGR